MSIGHPSIQRYVDQAMRQYGPGSTYNNNAWIQAALAPYMPGGARSSYPRNIINTLPQPLPRTAFPQPGVQFTPPRPAPVQSGAPVYNPPNTPTQLVPGQRHPATGNIIGGQAVSLPNGQTVVKYPNGSQTTYDVMPGQSVGQWPVNNPDNRTWGEGPKPQVINNGKILNAPPELGLPDYATWVQNIANQQASTANNTQYYGSKPADVVPPKTTTPPKTTVPKTQTPTTTVPKTPVQQQPVAGYPVYQPVQQPVQQPVRGRPTAPVRQPIQRDARGFPINPVTGWSLAGNAIANPISRDVPAMTWEQYVASRGGR